MPTRSPSPSSVSSLSQSSLVSAIPPAPQPPPAGGFTEPDLSSDSDEDKPLPKSRAPVPLPAPASPPPRSLSRQLSLDSEVEEARSMVMNTRQPSPHAKPAAVPTPPPPPPAAPQGPGSDLEGSEAETRAAKERRARKVRARSRTQMHPPSPPPEPIERVESGGQKSDRDREERRREKERLRELEREAEKERSMKAEAAKSPKDRLRRERRGSIRDKAEKDREKERERKEERDRERREAKEREAREREKEERERERREEKEREREREREKERERELAEKEKAKEREREKEKEKEKEKEAEERTSEEDRVKERRRERRNSIRVKDKDRERERERDRDRDRERERDVRDKEKERESEKERDKDQDEERVKERHRRDRRGSVRARDKERDRTDKDREREKAEKERERAEKERDRGDKEREAISHRPRAAQRYHDSSDRDIDREPDVRFTGVPAVSHLPIAREHNLERRHSHSHGHAHRDRERDRDRIDRERARENRSDESDFERRDSTGFAAFAPPPRAATHRPRRNSQPQPASPQRRQSLSEKLRSGWHGLRRDSSTRKSSKRNKSPPQLATVPAGPVSPPPVPMPPPATSPTRSISRPVSSSGVPIPPPAASPRGAQSPVGFDQGSPGVTVAQAIAIANNPRSDPVERLRAWLDQCHLKHGFHCTDTPPGMAPPPWRPEYVIDCNNLRLVHLDPLDEYVALSYVWGTDQSLLQEDTRSITLSSNLAEFCESMGEANINSAFMDSVWLVQKMGVRYLWIDKFCIVNDDDGMREDHIRNMPFVYANASFTIVVGLENVDLGLIPLDRKRAVPDSKAQLIDLIMESSWSFRAWTLQEALYSRRCVFVFKEVYAWECHCDTWQSNVLGLNGKHKILGGSGRSKTASAAAATSALKCSARVSPASLAYRHTYWPDMDEYARLVMDYSTRRLTYVQDTLRAFSGITHLLSRTFMGGFVYGMPVMFFDAAMLWNPQASLRRRVLPPASTGADPSGAPASPGPIPSWSWMGWFFDDIPIDTVIWRSAADYVETTPQPKNRHTGRRHVSQFHFRLEPMVKYTLTDRDPVTGQVYSTKLVSNGLEYRGTRFRKDTDLPPGWGFTREGYLRHDSDPATRFRYPIPVSPQDAGVVAADGPRGSLLSFTAERAFLHVQFLSTKPSPKDTISAPPVAVGQLLTRSGRFVGQVTAHDAWLGIQSSNYEYDAVSGEKLEVVALSVSSERGGSAVMGPEVFREHNREGMLGYVNVLWIERVGGVAYRRGLGHVLLDEWERLQRKEEVDVLLG
ncbi:hypothetical protein TD95_000337 [Thielaviopsis punctulata]|uniref:Heterokaryon incompatibility domain-containing protein n=1 Tax=Thielaviopsis punctulata TaxID=72032 RepID=A0A0F4Z6T5_9PEZI|nr:hypothetical protein TD95_000337 [Thielaviopsis punctulata]